MRLPRILALLLLASAATLYAASPGLTGDWREPGGSVIRIAPCGNDLCATLVFVRPDAPSNFDTHNPDASLHKRSLCGLQIGTGFHRDSDTQATGGSLYDPKTGKTYHGEMNADGDKLALRGYVGIRLFGRTETWTRTHLAAPCHAN
jgi:uncharacterized protein (DUF2147 family)